jgi:flagellum-specific ATP synthase
MAKLVERAGNFVGGGSITGIYTVLVEGDDVSLDPVADAAVGFLDGHVMLSRELANRRLFPAIDLVRSISRLTPQVVDESILQMQAIVMEVESIYRENSDVINLGLYKRGTSSRIDMVIEAHPVIEEFIRQEMNERVSFKESIEELYRLVEYIKECGERHGYRWSSS